MASHYETLGVARSANGDQIKSAFRKIARKHHPDVSQSEGSKERFFAAKEAYDVLSDPDKRRAYDATLLHDERIAENKRKSAEQAQERVRQAQADRSASADALRLSMFLNSHRFKDAENLARQILRDDPKSAAAYAALAEAASVRGELDAAQRYFSFAAQYAPDNKVYIEKSFAAQEALAHREARPTERSAPIAFGAGVFMVVTSAVYVVLAAEQPALPWLRPVSMWPTSLVVMLLIAGLSVGVSLCVGGALDVYDANRGRAVVKVPPATALGLVALLSFWVALAFYIVVGATQKAFNPSMSRFLGAVTAALMVFTVAGYALNSELARQTFIWGGNLLYLSGAVGWFVTDALKR